MLRLLGFFGATLVLLFFLRSLPVVGHLFHGFFGFWMTAILASLLAARVSRAWGDRRRFEDAARALGHVESAHNQGKLGSLLLAHGRPARALPHLERACSGEPEVAEWHYRRGLALAGLGRDREAVAALEQAAKLDPEHGYGGVQLALARTHLRQGADQPALAALEVFERNHGPSPESAYHRGLALKRGGHRERARSAFREVGALAARAAKFQRKSQRGWVLRSWLARVG